MEENASIRGMRVVALLLAGCCIVPRLAEADGEGGAQPTFRSGVKAPLPAGNLEVRVMKDDLWLAASWS